MGVKILVLYILSYSTDTVNLSIPFVQKTAQNYVRIFMNGMNEVGTAVASLPSEHLVVYEVVFVYVP